MSVEKEEINYKRGYLNKDFLLFHLKDQNTQELEPHYHEFHKIIIFVSGKVTYLIEGKAYKLKPYDIVFVSKNDIHKAQIDNSEAYERIILWMNDAFLQKESSISGYLSNCFHINTENNSKLMRINVEDLNNIKEILNKLTSSYSNKEAFSDILSKALFLQLMVYLNIYCTKEENLNIENGVSSDERINAVLDYINNNLEGDLSADFLAKSFFMSKYNLMHKFKKVTGYSLHSYIMKKRLMKANTLLKEGLSVGETCIRCGFGDYSNFIRAYKKMYGKSPKRNSII